MKSQENIKKAQENNVKEAKKSKTNKGKRKKSGSVSKLEIPKSPFQHQANGKQYFSPDYSKMDQAIQKISQHVPFQMLKAFYNID